MVLRDVDAAVPDDLSLGHVHHVLRDFLGVVANLLKVRADAQLVQQAADVFRSLAHRALDLLGQFLKILNHY